MQLQEWRADRSMSEGRIFTAADRFTWVLGGRTAQLLAFGARERPEPKEKASQHSKDALYAFSCPKLK
jgi:hypothetical protein